MPARSTFFHSVLSAVPRNENPPLKKLIASECPEGRSHPVCSPVINSFLSFSMPSPLPLRLIRVARSLRVRIAGADNVITFRLHKDERASVRSTLVGAAGCRKQARGQQYNSHNPIRQTALMRGFNQRACYYDSRLKMYLYGDKEAPRLREGPTGEARRKIMFLCTEANESTLIMSRENPTCCLDRGLAPLSSRGFNHPSSTSI